MHNDLKKIIGSFDMISDTQYKMNGELRDVEKIRIIDPASSISLSTFDGFEHESLNKMAMILTTDIYNHFYNATSVDTELLNPLYENDFLNYISEYNSGTGGWTEGWQLVEQESDADEKIVRNHQVNFRVKAHDVRKAVDGSHWYVRGAKECRYLNSHFYMAFSNLCKEDIPLQNHIESSTDVNHRLLRFYWNLTAKGSLKYMRAITRKLNAAGIYFKTKVISSPKLYNRSDAGVLYIYHSQLQNALPLIMDVYSEIAQDLKPQVPMFTKKLGSGLSFAEDPDNGDSFGISRAKLIAGALISAGSSDLTYSVKTHFNQADLCIDQPYARQSNIAIYESAFSHFTDKE